MTKTLIYHNNTYKYYKNGWIVLGSNVSDTDYLTYGIDDVSTVPESEWQKLDGIVEISFYTDDISKKEVQFKIKTEPYTLSEEFKGKEISIIEYTDDETKNESVCSIETEPFTIRDEFGHSFDILYYTDEKNKTSANLNLISNQSPLDDLDGEFELVTYTDDSFVNNLKANINAFPLGQIVVEKNDLTFYGLLNKVTINKPFDDTLNSEAKVAMSFDSGVTWFSYDGNQWISIDITSESDFSQKCMYFNYVEKISKSIFDIKMKDNKIRFAYYIDETPLGARKSKVKNITTIQKQALETPSLNKSSFYIVNTLSTIDFTLTGKDLSGKIDDIDGGKVKYKISLNGQPYYPSDGGYTDFSESPLDIHIKLSNKDILVDKQNFIRVDIMDYWGETDFWEKSFIGAYNGLIFKDANGGYYSDDIGNIIKYLDVGTLIAGQVSNEFEIKIFNSYGYTVKNLSLITKNSNDGVKIQLSKSTNPFIANDSLLWDEEIINGESRTFYLRISTEYTTPPVSGGTFEIRVDADQVM